MSIDKRREQLRNLIKKDGLYEVSETLGMKVHDLAHISKLQFDYHIAGEILWSLLYNNKLPKNYEGFEIQLDTMAGTYCWHRNRSTEWYGPRLKENVVIYATPFWDGNSSIPLEVNYYQVKTLNDIELLEQSLDIHTSIKSPKSWFNSVEELIVWYKEFYLVTVHSKIIENINLVRKRSKPEIIRRFDK